MQIAEARRAQIWRDRPKRLGEGVRIENGKYFCTLCGAELDVTEHDTVTTIAGASGKPNVRILSVKGKEIYRC